MNLVFSKNYYYYFIVLVATFTNLLSCSFTLFPPYLLKKPMFFITEINIGQNNIPLNNGNSMEFSKKYCDSSKYILKKDPIKSLHNLSYDYDLYCGPHDDIYELWLTISLFIGAIIGNIVLGPLPDQYGREKIFKYLSLFQLFLQINMVFNFGIIHLIIVTFFTGINLFLFPLSLLLIEEFVVENIGLIMGIFNSIYPLCGILLAFFFLTINNWKIFYIFLCISLSILNYFIFKYLYESPRWLYANGFKDKFFEVLTNVSILNGIEKEWIDFKKNNPDIISSLFSLNNKRPQKKNDIGIMTVFNSKSSKYKFIYCIIIWFCSACCFFGIILYLDTMKGNFFLNAILVFLGEFISENFCGKLTDIYGRKTINLIAVFLGTLFFGLYMIFPSQFSGITLMVSMMGFAGVFLTMAIITSELFPTQIRGITFSYCILTTRISTICIKIFGLFMNNTMINLTFLSCGIIAFLVNYKYIPETLDEKLKDFLSEDSGSILSGRDSFNKSLLYNDSIRIDLLDKSKISL